MSNKLINLWRKFALEILAGIILMIIGAVSAAVKDVDTLKVNHAALETRLDVHETISTKRLESIDKTTKKILCLALKEQSQCD